MPDGTVCGEPVTWDGAARVPKTEILVTNASARMAYVSVVATYADGETGASLSLGSDQSTVCSRVSTALYSLSGRGSGHTDARDDRRRAQQRSAPPCSRDRFGADGLEPAVGSSGGPRRAAVEHGLRPPGAD